MICPKCDIHWFDIEVKEMNGICKNCGYKLEGVSK